MTPINSDQLLSRFLGDNLQDATFRLVGYGAAAAALLALIIAIL